MCAIIFDEVRPGIRYGCHPDHRNGNRAKSQWTIQQAEEITAFTYCYDHTWFIGDRAWGLHYQQGSLTYLGVGVDRQRALFVARFEDGNSNQQWHGYPADHQRNVHDRLPEQLKELWIRNGVLDPAKVRKLSRGQPCSL